MRLGGAVYQLLSSQMTEISHYLMARAKSTHRVLILPSDDSLCPVSPTTDELVAYRTSTADLHFHGFYYIYFCNLLPFLCTFLRWYWNEATICKTFCLVEISGICPGTRSTLRLTDKFYGSYSVVGHSKPLTTGYLRYLVCLLPPQTPSYFHQSLWA